MSGLIFIILSGILYLLTSASHSFDSLQPILKMWQLSS